MMGLRLDYEIDTKLEKNLVTAHAGVPAVIEVYRQTGMAAAIEDAVKLKSRQRGLSESETVESFFALWTAGGARVEDFDHLRQDEALAGLIGHGLPAARTAHDFLAQFHQDGLPLVHEGKSTVPSESGPLQGLAAGTRQLVRYAQERRCRITATLDVDATLIVSSKRAAQVAYTGEPAYHPAIVVWAEQDLILHDELRDGNVPAVTGNRRLIEQAIGNLPDGIAKIFVRGDCALYDHDVMRWLETCGIGYAISAVMHDPLKACIRALPEDAWQADTHQEKKLIREWAEVAYVPTDRAHSKKEPPPPRYLAIRVRSPQGELFEDGSSVRYFAVVTNRLLTDGGTDVDPKNGTGLDLIHWHRDKAGTVEHCHDVLKNDLAAAALPSQKFGANAAWFRLNVMLYNVLSVLKRVGLPAHLHNARPKRLRFVLFNTVGKLVRHARETVLRFADGLARSLADGIRTAFSLPCPAARPRR